MLDPESAVRRYLAAQQVVDVDRIRELTHEDLVVEVPCAPRFVPPITHGRERFLDRLVRTLGDRETGLFASFVYTDLSTFFCENESVVFADYRSVGTFRSTGGPYSNKYLARFDFLGGLIVRFVEYFDPRITEDNPGSRGFGSSPGVGRT